MSKAAELAALIGSQTAQSNRNLIINGAMNVAQRGTSFADPADNNYSLDRMHFFNNNDGATTLTQDSTVPSGEGFYNSIKFDVTTADGTIGSDQYLALDQKIEGKNHAILGYGASGAKTIVVSFYAKSNLTGIYNYSVRNSALNRAYIKEFSITSASTWERISFTIPGDTSGTWLTTNGIGSVHQIALSMGSTFQGTANQWNSSNVVATSNQVNLLSSTDNEFFITGWQVEIGEVATPFEHRTFADDLSACQRYFSHAVAAMGPAADADSIQAFATFPVEFRGTPTFTITGALNWSDGYNADFVQSSGQVNIISNTTSDSPAQFLNFNNFSGLTTGEIMFFPRNSSNNNRITADAEL